MPPRLTTAIVRCGCGRRPGMPTTRIGQVINAGGCRDMRAGRGDGPPGGSVRPELWTGALKEGGSSNEQFDLHVRNFLDCIKTRQRPIADVEDGHRTATACHLANISLRVGRKVRWDAGKEEIVGDAEASKLLVRSDRKPWDAALRSVLWIWHGQGRLKIGRT